MMNIERARHILACYGGNPEQWPSDERAEMSQLLSSDKSLQALQLQALRLDSQLTAVFSDGDESDYDALAQRILANLPERHSDRYRGFLAGKFNRLFTRLRISDSAYRPVWGLAAGTLALVLAIGLFRLDVQPDPSVSLSKETDDAWMLMAEGLDNSSDLELLAVLEPELFEDDLDAL